VDLFSGVFPVTHCYRVFLRGCVCSLQSASAWDWITRSYLRCNIFSGQFVRARGKDKTS